MPGANGLAIRARLKPSASRYNFDWIDTAASYTVDTYAATSPATVKLNTLAPATLKAAIDAYNAGAGGAPRLQILASVGGTTVPVPVPTVIVPVRLGAPLPATPWLPVPVRSAEMASTSSRLDL